MEAELGWEIAQQKSLLWGIPESPPPIFLGETGYFWSQGPRVPLSATLYHFISSVSSPTSPLCGGANILWCLISGKLVHHGSKIPTKVMGNIKQNSPLQGSLRNVINIYNVQAGNWKITGAQHTECVLAKGSPWPYPTTTFLASMRWQWPEMSR